MPRSIAPVPFIQVDPKTNLLSVTDEARQILSALDGTVGVAAVAGVYRTGKSYILNQIAGRHQGFGIGSTVQACTKGIWLWGAPLQCAPDAPPDAPKHLILMDTEGLQSISQSEGHDAKIFCLAILLSSFFIYNSDKAVNNAAIDQLSLVTQLSKKIRVHAGDDPSGSRLAEFFPRFVWLLRDFQLELQDEDGDALTSNEYLEQCLQQQKGSSAAVKEQNQTRAAIRQLFEHRSCITLAHPTLGTNLPPSALKQLPELSKLAQGFQSGVNELRQRVLKEVRPKQVNGTPLTGLMLLGMADAYTKAINEGAVPTISTAWQSVLHIECGKALEAATSIYREGAHSAAMAEPPPSSASWQQQHEQLVRAALAKFREIAVGDNAGDYEARLLAAIEVEYKHQEELLTARSQALCQRLVSTISDRLAEYFRTAGTSHSERLPQLLDEVLGTFYAQASGPAREECLRQLLHRILTSVGDALKSVEAAAAADKERAGKQLAEAQMSLSQAEEASKEARGTRARLEASVQSLERANAQLSEQVKALSASASSAEAARAAADAEVRRTASDSEAQMRQLRAQIEQRDDDKGRLEAQLRTAGAELQKAQTRLATLEAEARALSTSGAAAQSKAQQDAQAALAAWREQEASLRAKQSELESETSALRRTNSELQLQLASLQATQQSTQTTEKAQLVELQRENDELRARLAAATSDGVGAGTKRSRPSAPLPPAPASEPAAAEEEHSFAMAEDMEEPPAPSSSNRRLSLDPTTLSIPKLQSMLREKLGQKAKLPKKKDDLQALCRQHGIF